MVGIQKILHETEERMKKTIEAVTREFNTIRTGRANPSVVEHLKISYYGALTPLRQLASISAPDARLIVIQPWDPSVVSEIEKAILKSDLGLTPMTDGKVIRLSIPQLSQERREELAKIIKKMAEDGRIALRTIRRDAKEQIEKDEKDKKVTEDDRFHSIDDLQKLIDKYIKKVDELLASKEAELKEV